MREGSDFTDSAEVVTDPVDLAALVPGFVGLFQVPQCLSHPGGDGLPVARYVEAEFLLVLPNLAHKRHIPPELCQLLADLHRDRLQFPGTGQNGLIQFTVAAANTTGVEDTHRELGSGFADALRSNDANRLPLLYWHIGGRQIAVAHPADAPRGLARQRRSDRNLRDARYYQLVGLIESDGLVAIDQDFPGLRVCQRGCSQPSGDPVLQRDVAVRSRTLRRPAVQGSAVLALHDYFLGDVDQPAREVPAACRVKRRVRQSLASTVGGQEVFQCRQPLAEVRFDR